MEDDLIHNGVEAYINQNYKTAVDQFSKCLEKNSENFSALIYRGCSLIKLGEYSGALTDFNNAEKIKGSNYDVLYNRSKAHFMNMDFKSGQDDLNKAQALENLSDEERLSIANLENRFLRI